MRIVESINAGLMILAKKSDESLADIALANGAIMIDRRTGWPLCLRSRRWQLDPRAASWSLGTMHRRAAGRCRLQIASGASEQM
jgi:hypothetical protein